MNGDHLNYVIKSRYYRFHIDCRYFVCVALVAIATAIVAKLVTYASDKHMALLYRKGSKNAKVSQMIQQKLCIPDCVLNLFPLDVKIA